MFLSEKVQPGWFDKNQGFYLSKNPEELHKLKDYEKDDEDRLINLISIMKNVDVDDIKYKTDDNSYSHKTYQITKPHSLLDLDIYFVESKFEDQGQCQLSVV